MERPSGSSRAVSRRQSRQPPDQEDDFSDHDEMENGDQTIHSRNLINNNNSTLRFDDKPEHLYGKCKSRKRCFHCVPGFFFGGGGGELPRIVFVSLISAACKNIASVKCQLFTLS